MERVPGLPWDWGTSPLSHQNGDRRLTEITARVDWISAAAGGRAHPPFCGLRPMVRWQRHVGESQESAWDGEICRLAPPEDDYRLVQLRFVEKATINPDWLAVGELIELLDGARVIAVGVIEQDAAWDVYGD